MAPLKWLYTKTFPFLQKSQSVWVTV